MELDPRVTHKASGAGGAATARAVAALGVYKAGVSACVPHGRALPRDGRPDGGASATTGMIIHNASKNPSRLDLLREMGLDPR